MPLGFSAGIQEGDIWETQMEEQSLVVGENFVIHRNILMRSHTHIHNHRKELIPPLSQTQTHMRALSHPGS